MIAVLQSTSFDHGPASALKNARKCSALSVSRPINSIVYCISCIFGGAGSGFCVGISLEAIPHRRLLCFGFFVLKFWKCIIRSLGGSFSFLGSEPFTPLDIAVRETLIGLGAFQGIGSSSIRDDFASCVIQA